MSNVTLMAVGDISLQTKNSKHPFAKIHQVFKDKDILFGNLEVVLSSQGERVQKAVVLNAPPESARYLTDAAFDILNLANNHVMDLSGEGFHNTISALRKVGLNFIGAADQPGQGHAILARKGLKIGFLGYTESNYSVPEDNIWINHLNLATIIKDIESIKSYCDFIIVSLHWGIENVYYPSPPQIKLAHSIIDAGASVIIGHHPHIIQGVEEYKQGLIFYSLGNFQFDNHLSQSRTNDSMIVSIEFNNERIEKWEVIPITIDSNSVPQISSATEKNNVINLVDVISAPINNNTISRDWWFEMIAGEYLSGNFNSFKLRIKKYGILHFLQCAIWLISPFCLQCYAAIIRRRTKILLRAS